MKTLFAWIITCGLMCLGGCLVITAPLSRLGLGEPGTGMSWEEYQRINAEIAASPWTPVPFVVVGLVLLIVPSFLTMLWSFEVWGNKTMPSPPALGELRTAAGLAGSVSAKNAEPGAVLNGGPAMSPPIPRNSGEPPSAS